MAKHSIVGASGSSRWMRCHGSPWLERTMPEEKDKFYADMGSGAHQVAELIQRDGYEYEEALEAMDPKWQRALDELDADMDEFHDAVYTYIDWMNKVIEEDPGARVLYEDRINLGFINREMFGTADFSSIQLFDKLRVGDYKHGSGVVVEIESDFEGETICNPQGAYYGLGQAHRFGYNFDTIEITIIQPRAYHVEGPIRSRTYPMEEFRLEWTERFERQVAYVMEAKTDPLRHLVAGDHCRFCSYKAECPAIREKTYELAQMDFDPVTIEGELVEQGQPAAGSLPKPEDMTMAQLTAVLDNATMIDSWIKAVNEHALKLIDSGTTVPGYKVVPSRPTRKWIDEKKVRSSLARRKAVTEEDYIAPGKMLSPNQFEKRHKRSNPKLWDAMQKHIHKVSGSRTLAREDDKRPALEHQKAKDDFDAIPGSAPKTSKAAIEIE